MDQNNSVVTPITPLMDSNLSGILLPGEVLSVSQNSGVKTDQPVKSKMNGSVGIQTDLKLSSVNDVSESNPTEEIIQIILPDNNFEENTSSEFFQNSISSADNNASFYVTFPHAGAFCALIEYLHGGHGTGTTNQSYFEMTDKILSYVGRDVSKTVLNYARIFRCNTTKFITESFSEDSYRFFIKLKELRDHLKPFPKKNSISLAKYPGKQQVYIQGGTGSDEHGEQQIQFVNLLPMDANVTYGIPSHSEIEKDSPNAVIYSASLHSMCKSIATDGKIEVRGTETSICFGIPAKGQQKPSGVWRFTSPINTTPIGTGEFIVDGKASGGVIKNLGRLSALAPNSVIKVYFISRTRIKLVAPIEHVGILDVHITLS